MLVLNAQRDGSLTLIKSAPQSAISALLGQKMVNATHVITDPLLRMEPVSKTSI